MPQVDPISLYRLRTFQFKERIESTCVNDVAYDPETMEMTINFQQRGSYKYYDVPLDVYIDFETSGSRGKYFNYYIKEQFSYERIA